MGTQPPRFHAYAFIMQFFFLHNLETQLSAYIRS